MLECRCMLCQAVFGNDVYVHRNQAPEIQKNHAESESSIPRGGSVSHWHGSELCYFTEQGLGSFQLLQ